jgi:hypothetical protein
MKNSDDGYLEERSIVSLCFEAIWSTPCAFRRLRKFVVAKDNLVRHCRANHEGRQQVGMSGGQRRDSAVPPFACASAIRWARFALPVLDAKMTLDQETKT